jgi:hypothetical protein
MILSKIFFGALLLLATNSHSQDTEKKAITDVFKVSFLDPGIGYEKRIGSVKSLVMQAFLGLGLQYGYSSSFGSHFNVSVDPGANLQYRYYYNRKQREKRAKRIDMNSLNYFAGIYEIIFTANRIFDSDYEEENRRPIHVFGLMWGMQRNYKKRFSLDLNIGPGYLFSRTTTPDDTGEPIKGNGGKFTLLSHINLGLWLNKPK